MLTRAGVARKLRKSIATVRRMEGVDLHPEVDDHGVHWFHVAEVDAALSRRSTGRSLNRGQSVRAEWRARREGFSSVADEFSSEPSSQAEKEPTDGSELATAQARAWAEQARADALVIQLERQRIESEQRRALAADERANRELASAREALLDELASWDAKTLRRLSRRDVDELIALLEND